MLIGVDFDNTIVCWDQAFHTAALEQGLIPLSVPVSKEKVRDHLRACGREDAWIELQGFVYGARAGQAPLFPGVKEFFTACRQGGQRVAIISHKTRHPFMGPLYDLHDAARECLRLNGFYDAQGIGLPASEVYFELSKAEKLTRIAGLECTHFIDDLPEFLDEPAFPTHVERILFDPNGYHGEHPRQRRVTSWADLQQLLLGQSVNGS